MSGIAHGLVRDSVRGVAKAFGNADDDGTPTAGSFNISGVTRNATGDYSWSFNIDFADVNYTTQVTQEAQAVNNATISIDRILVGSIGVNLWEAATASDTRDDDGHQLTAFGDQ